MDSFQFIRYVAVYHKHLNFKAFALAYSNIYYPDQDVDFMHYLIKTGMPENKFQCIVSHKVLQERGALDKSLSLHETVQYLEENGLSFRDDFIHSNKELLITPVAFVFILMLNASDTHFDYQFMIEEVVVAYELYRSML